MDTIAPGIPVFTQAPPTGAGPTSATLSFAVAGDTVTFECSPDAASWTACASPLAVTATAGTPYAIHIRPTDLAGNIGASYLSANWNPYDALTSSSISYPNKLYARENASASAALSPTFTGAFTSLSYALTLNIPSGLTIDGNGVLDGTAGTGTEGLYAGLITATDLFGTSKDFNVNIEVINNPDSSYLNGNQDISNSSTLSSMLTTSSDFSISFWYRTLTLPGSGQTNKIFSLWNGELSVSVDENGFLVVNPLAATATTATPLAQVGGWHHLVLVKKSDDTADVFSDGLGVLNVAASGMTLNAALRLGSSAGGYQGLIDELGVFETPLSLSEIQSIYSNGHPHSLTHAPRGSYTAASVGSLLRYWKLGSNLSGSPARTPGDSFGGSSGTDSRVPGFTDP